MATCPFPRAAAADECECDKFDFVAAKALNKEGLNRFVQERSTIAVLNDRLVRLIELVRRSTTSAANETSSLKFSSCFVMPLFCVERINSVCALQARCFEEENESLECQITELEEKLNNKRTSNATSIAVEPDYSMDAVVERLCKQRVGCCWVCLLHVFLCDGMPKESSP